MCGALFWRWCTCNNAENVSLRFSQSAGHKSAANCSQRHDDGGAKAPKQQLHGSSPHLRVPGRRHEAVLAQEVKFFTCCFKVFMIWMACFMDISQKYCFSETAHALLGMRYAADVQEFLQPHLLLAQLWSGIRWYPKCCKGNRQASRHRREAQAETAGLVNFILVQFEMCSCTFPLANADSLTSSLSPVRILRVILIW